ncbi:DUF3052 domain-containing protein [Streptomyces sp. NPDC016459]|uniref:DUF3052 domain-containing protein n=1 Tax=Streptomyces sp. NPDC016459 TaxID=3157190 RepID=UPI003410DF21
MTSASEQEETREEPREESDYGVRLGFSNGMVVQELGEDDDVDDSLRKSVEETIGRSLVRYDHEGPVDVALLWFREGDGDLVDILTEAADPLSADGHIWVLTPNPGKPGHADPGEIAEAAPEAGLSQTGTVTAGAWTAWRLARPTALSGHEKTPGHGE